MDEPESKPETKPGFGKDLRALFNRYPTAKWAFFFLFYFTFFSFSDAIFPWSSQTYTYGGHVVAVAWRSAVFSTIFFFVLGRRRRP